MEDIIAITRISPMVSALLGELVGKLPSDPNQAAAAIAFVKQFAAAGERVYADVSLGNMAGELEDIAAESTLAPAPVSVDVVRSRWFEKAVEYAVPRPDGAGTHQLVLLPGDVFQVRGDLDMSEGRGGTYQVGLFTDLSGALTAAKGRGAQGGLGYTSVVRATSQLITATNHLGEEVPVGTSTTLGSVKWETRLTEQDSV